MRHGAIDFFGAFRNPEIGVSIEQVRAGGGRHIEADIASRRGFVLDGLAGSRNGARCIRFQLPGSNLPERVPDWQQQPGEISLLARERRRQFARVRDRPVSTRGDLFGTYCGYLQLVQVLCGQGVPVYTDHEPVSLRQRPAGCSSGGLCRVPTRHCRHRRLGLIRAIAPGCAD